MNTPIYLFHTPGSYGDTFQFIKKRVKTSTVADHNIYQNGNVTVICAQKPHIKFVSPDRINEIKERLVLKELTYVDKLLLSNKEVPVVQIIDHVNISGENPLTGKTPYLNYPQFPDLSNAYMKVDLNLPQKKVTTVGHRRFIKMEKTQSTKIISESAAWIATIMSYLGIKITALGWNQEADEHGKKLGGILFGSVLSH